MSSSLGQTIKNHKIAVEFISMLLCSSVFGIAVALQFQPIETVIELPQSTVVKQVIQSEGPYTITYITTGPSILSFEKDCDEGKGSLVDYCGIDLKYDGKSGIIDLKIPSSLMQEIDPVREIFTSYFFFPTQLPFQRISNDDSYTVFRIQVPAKFGEIRMHGSSLPDLGPLIVKSFVAAVSIFFGLLISLVSIDDLIKKIRKSRVGETRF